MMRGFCYFNTSPGLEGPFQSIVNKSVALLVFVPTFVLIVAQVSRHEATAEPIARQA